MTIYRFLPLAVCVRQGVLTRNDSEPRAAEFFTPAQTRDLAQRPFSGAARA